MGSENNTLILRGMSLKYFYGDWNITLNIVISISLGYYYFGENSPWNNLSNLWKVFPIDVPVEMTFPWHLSSRLQASTIRCSPISQDHTPCLENIYSFFCRNVFSSLAIWDFLKYFLLPTGNLSVEENCDFQQLHDSDILKIESSTSLKI